MVNRLERAYAFEVRTALPEKPTPEQEACGATVRAFTTVTFQQIGTPLLSLPEAVLHGSTELECFEPVKVGDVITVSARVSSVRERLPMTFINLELEQHNQKGVLVARCKQLAILRGKA